MSGLLSRAAWTRPYALPFLALFAFNLLVFLAFTLPFSFIERGRAQDALALRTTIEAKRADINAIRAEADVIESNRKQAKTFYESMPTCAAARVQMNLDLYQIAKQLGMEWERSTMREEPMKGAPLVELETSMPLAGTYERVGTFLQKIEGSTSFLVVDRIGLHERPDNLGTNLDAHVNGYCSTAARPETKP
jgi:hypothetical protein